MERRNFIKTLCIASAGSMLAPGNIIASNACDDVVTVKMVGDLDDDLFVMRATNEDWTIEDCYQMHNQSKRFTLEGKHFESIHIGGYIEFQKDYLLQKDEYLLIGLANEREDRDNRKALLARTHYKSAPLHVNGSIAVPSMIPENNDMPDVPTWFAPHEDMAVYNYYRAWENALVNVVLVFPKEGRYTVSLSNAEGDIVATETFDITGKVTNTRFKKTIHGPLDEHPMTEIDGGVFLVEGKRQPVDEDVVRLCPTQVLIMDEVGGMVRIPLPYPFPYVNRVFCVAKSF